MIYEAMCREARALSSHSLAVPMQNPESTLAERRAMWLEMLGLSPLPERAPLEAAVTGVLERGDYAVEKIHFQSLPGAYVPGNLYRPLKPEGPLPAVLYLCGHTKGKVNPPYQANPRWFGQHGYAALVLDPIQLGESQGVHHGTFHLGRWDWYSRGYTPAGMEVWNAMRALDYLQSRADVDSERLGVTGLSGGGAISWFLGAADERVRCVAPVCQTGSIEHLITDRATDGHCDCAFWINYYRWCIPDIGALIAPRPLLVAAGTEDDLWRPYAFRDVMHRIAHQYKAAGVEGKTGLIEDISPHGYTPKIRKAIFEWFNLHLKGDASPVTDDVSDYVEPEENLLVFGGKLPEEDAMRRADTILVEQSDRGTPVDAEKRPDRRREALSRLRATTFRHIPASPAPRLREWKADGAEGLVFSTYTLDTEDGLTIRVKTAVPTSDPYPLPVALYALQPEETNPFAGGSVSRPAVGPGIAIAGVEVRNTGITSTGPGYLWTMRRAYPLLGKTLPERQICDLLSALALIRSQPFAGPVAVYGRGYTAVLALYAALLDSDIPEVILADLPETHEDPAVPELLGILRIGDLPDNAALLCPRPITFVGKIPEAYERTRQIYETLGAGDRLRVIESVAAWRSG
ncbi:MAG: acetylxylan esterase [Armatimonadetes bacterium]|nr:acetylxylan esterase [Armatimonadota bacterium]